MKYFFSFLFFISFFFNYSSIIAQPNKDLAKKHFLKYLDSKTHIDLLVNCLPTKKETNGQFCVAECASRAMRIVQTVGCTVGDP